MLDFLEMSATGFQAGKLQSTYQTNAGANVLATTSALVGLPPLMITEQKEINPDLITSRSNSNSRLGLAAPVVRS